jgi:hypothetical protein
MRRAPPIIRSGGALYFPGRSGYEGVANGRDSNRPLYDPIVQAVRLDGEIKPQQINMELLQKEAPIPGTIQRP